MKTILGAAVLLAALLLVQAQNTDCPCKTHHQAKCDTSTGNPQDCGPCTLAIGPTKQLVDCSKLIPKCWLMKRESLQTKEIRRPKPANALIDNDGLYNPDCDSNGTFKARQCNNTETCWCVNSAGVRRTDKGDKNWKCPELVRTYWVVVQLKIKDMNDVAPDALKVALRDLITSRYGVPASYIDNIELQDPLVYIDLKQNSSTKRSDVDIADVGYYLEKDVKGDLFMDQNFDLYVNGRSIGVQEPLIMYIDEKPHEISMKRLTAGVIAVIVVVVVAIVAGIVVLVLTRRKRGRYEKAEMKEMNEMQREINS